VAYCPLGRPTSAADSTAASLLPDLRKDDGVQKIAEKTGKSIF
jgi:hypothetical protein